jgi:hypothetical protein
VTFAVANIGAGLIGKKRASALREFSNGRLRGVADINQAAAESLSRETGAQPETDWQRVVSREDVDVIVVATINQILKLISVVALENHKHVLCEKPLGRDAREALAAGSHIVTVLPKLLEGMIVDPYSNETVQQFLRDARKVEEVAAEGIAVHGICVDAEKSSCCLDGRTEKPDVPGDGLKLFGASGLPRFHFQ